MRIILHYFVFCCEKGLHLFCVCDKHVSTINTLRNICSNIFIGRIFMSIGKTAFLSGVLSSFLNLTACMAMDSIKPSVPFQASIPSAMSTEQALQRIELGRHGKRGIDLGGAAEGIQESVRELEQAFHIKVDPSLENISLRNEDGYITIGGDSGGSLSKLLSANFKRICEIERYFGVTPDEETVRYGIADDYISLGEIVHQLAIRLGDIQEFVKKIKEKKIDDFAQGNSFLLNRISRLNRKIIELETHKQICESSVASRGAGPKMQFGKSKSDPVLEKRYNSISYPGIE